MNTQPRNTTTDAIFDGSLSCRQHVSGYRFSVDSVLLADFVEIKKNDTVLELGTGCGVVGLILCYRHQSVPFAVTGIECQRDLAELARINIAENGYEDTFSIIEGDLTDHRRMFQPESFSLVISNPPFFARGTGRINDDAESGKARHQNETKLEDFVSTASFCVKNRGRVFFVFPAVFSIQLIELLTRHRLTPKTVQYLYSYPESEQATLMLVEAVKNGGAGCTVRAPFYLYQYKNGPYSDRAKRLYDP